ncbi:MAG: alpha/beta hydrolase [Chloroflexota bacterium]
MPILNHDGASLYYEETGGGIPLLLLAPGGLNSSIAFWGRTPTNPLETFAGEYRVIAMDQRNADRSRGPLDPVDPWGTYARDQMAVLDHLGIDRFLVAGCCIGSSFILRLIHDYPQRVAAGILMQPIGEDETNVGHFGEATWAPWGKNLQEEGATFSQETLARFGRAMFDPGFVFSVSREFCAAIETPLLLMYGNDRAHPRGTSVELQGMLKNLEVIERWRDAEHVDAAVAGMRAFLAKHARQA